ncbi:MAG: diguanylate cyclase [Desulfovibrio sp.]|uniref:diguanylate cyclase domain-containing protein n=1 Tax=Desulfovibrio sp. TaxID=885 RepID=UPI00258C5CA5|nr:diguanylate cyclase [Desulfovibrio sp.]MCD7984860.1 diguanylate cyclase [Desulfovibrio sp.]
MYTIHNEANVGPLGRRGVALTSEIMNRHYVRDEDFVWDQLVENVMWIGPLPSQIVTGLDKVKALLAQERDVTFTMEQEEYFVPYESEDSCVVSGCYYVTSDPETKLFIRCHQRVSFFYRLFGDRLKVVHMHLSHPYEVTDPDEYFPFRFGKEAYEYIASTHQLAFTDSLTELGNRNAYETDLLQLSEHLPDMGSLGMVLFDLNNLKMINDSLGHLAGDQLIRSFAFLLKESMPDTAKLYRYGGDEFAVFLPQTDRGVLERALQELEDRKEAYNAANATRLSFAAGHAFFKKGMDNTLSDVIKRADSRLYARKRAMKKLL